MESHPEVAVLRLGHRPGRDDRMTTHVALTARALGADRVILPTNATDAVETASDVTDRFGGPFRVETSDDLLGTVRRWEGVAVHLTMYGERVQNVEAGVRERHADAPLLIVLGAEKVPFEVYDHADYNVAVTSQPHSEVAALAVFLDRLFVGRELDREWVDPDRAIVPQSMGKRVEERD
jgi:tRNA (cytidine56-2'-O)-methyltransferase